MLKLLIARLRELVWPAVISVLLIAVSLVIVVVSPGFSTGAGVFALAGIGFAILAQRA
jgi:hypothetical protein